MELAKRSLTYLALIAMAVFMLFPFIWMVSTAVKPFGEIYTWPPRLIPHRWAFNNFPEAWKVAPFSRFFVNSFVVATVSTIMAVVLNSLSGYALAKYNFPGRNVLFFIVLSTLMIPFQVTMVPVFMTLSNMGLLNSYWGLILPGTASAFGIFMMRQFLHTIPDELIDAARIDGSGEFGIYWRIILPLTKPALAVLAIFTFMWRWNDFLWPLIVLDSEEMFTVQLGLSRFQGEYYVEWNYLMAMTLVSLIPMLVVFLLFQRYFVKGIAMTGMKG